MTNNDMQTLSPPYLIFMGDVQNRIHAKTGQGLVDWRPEHCMAQLRLPTCTIDLGLPDMSIAEAKAEGVQSLVIGVAPVGGAIKPEWIELFVEALQHDMHIICGLHTTLADYPSIAEAEQRSQASIFQVRVPPANLPIGTGIKRRGKRLLMVGMDCAVGKMYSALSLERAMKARGMKATFRATGQTGILIAGQGIPMDAVVSDFIAGAAEILTPDNEADHWDVIEGQGALHHPGYAAVSLGILHGSQPDAIVMCHEATRQQMDGFPQYSVGDINQRIGEALIMGRITNPDIQCVGICVNTAWLLPEERQPYLDELEAETGLPCIDPKDGNLNPIIDNLA